MSYQKSCAFVAAFAIIQVQGISSISAQYSRNTYDPTKPRMALCIVGAGRTLSNSRVHTSIPMISSTIEAQGLLQNHIDLFVHISVGNSNYSKMRAAMDYLQPADFRLEEGEGPYPMDESVDKYTATPGCQRNMYHYPKVVGACMNYYYHIESCHGMLKRHEKASRDQYDVVMFARADLQWKDGLPQKVLDAAVTRSYMTLQHDFFMVVPRDVATDLSTMLEDYFTVGCVNMGTPEYLVRDAAQKSGRKRNVSVDYTWERNSLFELVRAWVLEVHHDPEGYKWDGSNQEDYLEHVQPFAAWE
jgi:hypothetical protein